MNEEIGVVLAENYSENEDFMYEIYKREDGMYDVWLFEYNIKMKGFFVRNEDRSLLETLEEATQMAEAMLVKLDATVDRTDRKYW